MQNWIISYDIDDSGARHRACRLLRRYSSGYQNSGFELVTPAQTLPLTQSLAACLSDQDQLLISRRQQSSPDWQLGRSNSQPGGELLVWT